jgi:hypothetical protein
MNTISIRVNFTGKKIEIVLLVQHRNGYDGLSERRLVRIIKPDSSGAGIN